jgi:hypothetical protein
VFDTIVEPSVQHDLFAGIVDGWSPRRYEIDLRVGGTWKIEFGPTDGDGEAERSRASSRRSSARGSSPTP